jgi:glutamyl-Q tRNA(Asp) synthetase
VKYRGRFAPSPTGPLHFGSLVTAVASYLDAKARGGEWFIRMEDLDTPRCIPGSDAQILRTLEAYGFEWDGPVLYQSQRVSQYRDALHFVKSKNYVYECSCSRSAIYPGTCRNGVQDPSKPLATRVRVENQIISFSDRNCGIFEQNLEKEVGDFVLLRSDGLFSYQLAVVVDDAAQQITDVVRGEDLLDSTPRQIWLQRLLEIPTPRYFHVNLAKNEAGEKLSKQTKAPPLDSADAFHKTADALRFLKQPISPDAGTPAELFAYALLHIDRDVGLRGK